MLKNKLDFKLVNLALIVLIMFLIYRTGNLWIGIFDKVFAIVMPIIIAFALAYAVHPFLVKMQEKGLPKWLGVTIIVISLIGLAALIIYLISTVLVGQLSSLFNSIMQFISSLEKSNFDINVAGLESTLQDTFKTILSNLGTYVSDGAINLVNTSLALMSKLLIIFAVFIYLLIDMDKIRKEVKAFFKSKSQKTFNYVKTLDDDMKKYLNGLVQVMVITLIEYTLGYTIIGHPNAILLGFLACVANLIPYFGGIGVNIIAAITAFVVSPSLLVKTIIAFCVLSTLDSYVINPTVYGKTNKIHPLATIIALFASGILLGIKGVFISSPLAIMAIVTFKYYKEDIKNNIKKVKNSD